MKVLKRSLVVLAVVGVVGLSGLNVHAESGIVDMDKVVSSYSKAQDVSADLKVKEAELQKFLADAQKQLKDASTPLERKNLEDKLTEEFKTRSDSYRDDQVKQWKQIEDDVYSAMSAVRTQRKLDMVLNKAGVFLGGVDITDQVIAILNSKGK